MAVDADCPICGFPKRFATRHAESCPNCATKLVLDEAPIKNMLNVLGLTALLGVGVYLISKVAKK